MRILAISGSLRTGSSNTRLVETLAGLAPEGVEVAVYRGLGALPHFNPDLDTDDPPASVAELRGEIGLCDGLVICSPEYAHGVAGLMKNGLDWLVGSLEFSGTPVALINAQPRAVHAQAHMRDTLQVMDARIIEAASIAVPPPGPDDAEAYESQLRAILAAFIEGIRAVL